jgi:RNA polymerase sigma-70 factor (ECF subfamily)
MNAKQTMSDTIQAAKGGNLEAFNRLVLEYQDDVYSFTFRTLGEEQAAQETTRLIFQDAYRQLPGFRSGAFRLWLLRLAARTCMRRLKDWRATYRTPPSIRTSPAENSLQACLRLIPPDLRLALILVDLEGLTYPEAAAVLNASPAKVLARLAQARQWVLQSQGPNFAAA